MRMIVMTKKTLYIIAGAVIGLILAIVLAIALASGGNEGEPNTGSAQHTSGKPVVTGSSQLQTSNPTGLSTAVEPYELEVLAGFKKELPVYSVAREDKRIALTIDAAWEDDKTPFIISTLAKYNIKATFFLCGFWVEAYPEQVKAIYDAGHEIGNHTMTHPHMNQLTSAQILDELNQFDDLLEGIIGVRSTLFRAPYGEYNDNVIKTVRAAGYEILQWSIDTIDWKPERSSQTILDTVLPKLADGCIILSHNNGFKLEEYLPTLIETALSQGYEFVVISDLLLDGNTIIDVNGVQKHE